jgi:hypothetical protein
MRKGSAAVVLVVLAALVPTGGAFAGRADDQEVADEANLVLAEVPDGFEEVEVPDDAGDDADAIQCAPSLEAVDAVAERAPSSNRLFSLPPSQGYALISSQVAVLPKARLAKKLLNAYQDEAAASECVQLQLEDLFSDVAAAILEADVEVSVSAFAPELDDKGSEEVVTGGDEYAGYAGSVTRSVEGGEPQFFEAQLVVGRVGRSAFRLFVVTSGVIPRDDVVAMMQTLVDGL